MSKKSFERRQLRPFIEIDKASIRDYLTLGLFIASLCVLFYFFVRWIIRSDDPMGDGVLSVISVIVVCTLIAFASKK